MGAFGPKKWLTLGFLALCGCGGPAYERTSAPVRVAPPLPATAPPASPSPSLKRSDVAAVVAEGLGAFLQRVELEDRPVVTTAGAFRGFRIKALHDEAFWRGVDLVPGDVVTSVNGFPIERPEQAQVAFDSLGVASEVRIAYERDGVPREIVYAIVLP